MKTTITSFFLFFFFFTSSIYAFDSVEIKSPDITLHKSGYFTVDKDITPEEALKLTKEGQLKTIPFEAKSLGYDHKTYWYFFELKHKNINEKYYLDLKHTVTEYGWLYTFEEGTLTKIQRSGYALSLNSRSLKTIPARFELDNGDKTVVYLLKIQSHNTQYAAFAFGNSDDLNTHWYILYGVTLVTFGVFLGLFLYNGFLLFATKDKSYFFYLVYTAGLMFYDLFDVGLVSFVVDNNLSVNLAFAKIFELFGLILFTIHFLQLKTRNTSLYKFFLAFSVLVVIMSFLYLFDIGRYITVILIYMTTYILIFIGIISYRYGNKVALYYLLATGGGIVFVNIFFLMPLGILPLNLWGLNLLNLALIWDMVMFSLALAYRIKLLHSEKEASERMLQARSRFAIIGETLSTVAHQWKQPLARLGAIHNNLQAQFRFRGNISHDDLLESLEDSNKTIKQMAQTLTTFQQFFDNSPLLEPFILQNTLQQTLETLQPLFDEHNISVHLSLCKNITVKGNKEELFQALTNILTNAKDALMGIEGQRNITLTLTQTSTHATLIIDDNGGGIKKHGCQKIFEPYISTKELNGMGIGLFITKNIIEKMGGTITAHNNKQGASFTLIFPKFS